MEMLPRAAQDGLSPPKRRLMQMSSFSGRSVTDGPRLSPVPQDLRFIPYEQVGETSIAQVNRRIEKHPPTEDDSVALKRGSP